MGGPIGALLGLAAGYAVDSGVVGAAGRVGEEATRKITFTIGVIALSAKMAKADGQVTKDEVEAFKHVFRIPPHEAKNVGRVFDMARQDVAGFESYARQIAELFVDNRKILEDLLGALFYIAKADGVIHPGEIAYLERVSEIFGFSETEFEHLRALHLGDAQADPYSILGLSPDVTDAQLKKEYRKLIKENHPDRVIAHGLPEEFIEVANERLSAINVAYDRIAAERGLK